MQKIYDISLPITSDMTVWPGDPMVTIRQVSSLEKGESSNVSQIRMSVHTGTHIDAPLHFLRDGKAIGAIPLSTFTGPALVLEMGKDVDVINQTVLADHPQIESLKHARKVLFKTRNSIELHNWGSTFNEHYVALDASGATFLSNFDLDLVGVDYLSIAAFYDTDKPHQILLQKEVVLLEGINLMEVPAGVYNLYCLPLNLIACEGAPARAILTME